MLDILRIENFADRVGETFRLRLDSGDGVDLELVEATGTGGTELERKPFSLVFRAPEGAVEQQQIFRLEHDDLGELDLFLVPLGPGKEGMLCEAVFT